MVGPVFSLELLQGGRRGRLQTLRRIYAGWLVLQLAFLFLNAFLQVSAGLQGAQSTISRFLNSYAEIFIAQHFIVLFLLTPPFVAGAITDEKTQGTFQDLLTTDLTSWQIVAGKLLGRTAQVALLSLPEVPILFFMAGYCNLSLWAPLAFVGMTVAPLVALGAASLLASVWGKQTRDAVVSVFLGFGLGGLALWGLTWGIENLLPTVARGSAAHTLLSQVEYVLQCFNPLYVLEPAWDRFDALVLAERMLVGSLAWGALGAGCLSLAVWRLRPAYQRQIEAANRSAKSGSRRRARAVWEDDPVRWKEAKSVRAAPLSFGGWVPVWLGAGIIAVATVYFSLDILDDTNPAQGFFMQTLVVLLAASLVAAIQTSGTVSGEREKQTWEGLLLTSLETWEIIGDKLWGILDGLLPYFLAYAIPAAALAGYAGGNALFVTIATLLVAVAATYYVGANGIWCSVRSRSSWRSLLATLATGYGSCLVLLFLLSMLYAALGCLALPIAFALGLGGVRDPFRVLGVLCILLIGVGVTRGLWKGAVNKTDLAVRWVDDEERERRTFSRVLAHALKKHAERREGHERESRV